MMLVILSGFALVCASIPAAMFIANAKLFNEPPQLPPHCPAELAAVPEVSVLIPARDEAAGIEATIRAALNCEAVALEVIVLDDHSSDDTAGIVAQIAANDNRVRLEHGLPLLEGWNGKQFACYQLAELAKFKQMVFLDADVQLTPDSIARLIRHRARMQTDLLSAFPCQVTETWLEKWLIPLMHFILLGFLPIKRMRRSNDPAYSAGCGQLFVTDHLSYRRAGTHAAIRNSRHDGLTLPRAFRKAGLRTDIVDGTSIASCRMYHSAKEVVHGLMKNAIEGIANPRLIVPFTILLIGGTLLPVIALGVAVAQRNTAATGLSIAAMAISHLPRIQAAIRFCQPWQTALFHIPAVTLFVTIQWQALLNHCLGKQVTWRGRS